MGGWVDVPKTRAPGLISMPHMSRYCIAPRGVVGRLLYSKGKLWRGGGWVGGWVGGWASLCTLES